MTQCVIFLANEIESLEYSQSTDSSAPNAVLCKSFLGGYAVYPVRNIFSAPNPSADLKIEPTLCTERTFSTKMDMGTRGINFTS